MDRWERLTGIRPDGARAALDLTSSAGRRPDRDRLKRVLEEGVTCRTSRSS